MGKAVIIDLDFSRHNLGKVTIDDDSADANGNIVFKDAVVKAICTSQWGDGQNLSLTQAEGVTSIPLNIFSNNKEVTSFDEFELFANVTELIGDFNNGAFFGTSLKSMKLPKSITKLGNDAFMNSSDLKMEIDLPNLTTIGFGVFHGTGITKIKNLGKLAAIGNAGSSSSHYFAGNCPNLSYVVLPSTLTSIGTYAFAYCPALTEIICHAATPPKLASNTFAGTTSNIRVIRVPAEAVDAYKVADVWSNYADIIVAI